MTPFELDSRNNYVYPSVQGDLTSHDLWNVSFSTTMPHKASLDAIYDALMRQKDSQPAHSLTQRSTGTSIHLDAKIAVVEQIYAIRKEENAQAAVAKENKEFKALLRNRAQELRVEEMLQGDAAELIARAEALD